MTWIVLAAVLSLLGPHHQPFMMPMDVGTEWIYDGSVAWTQTGTNIVQRAHVRWKTRVVSRYAHGAAQAAVLEKSPFESAWYSPDEATGFSVFAQNPAGIFMSRAVSRAEAERIAESSLSRVEGLEQVLAFPVTVGRCTGETAGRTDQRYCWLVARRFSEGTQTGWELTYRTAPDHTIVRIAPGVGITEYEYVHHGTVQSSKLKLVTFKERRRRSL